MMARERTLSASRSKACAGAQSGPGSGYTLRRPFAGGRDHTGRARPITRSWRSLVAGKLADMIVLDKNPLEKIENSDSLNMTIINGVVYDANSMDHAVATTGTARQILLSTVGN